MTEKYWGKHNEKSKQGIKSWADTRRFFQNKCAFCGKKKKLQKDHLRRLNKIDCGFHYPGNIVPACSNCNQKGNDAETSWNSVLKTICDQNKEKSKFAERKNKILLFLQRHDHPSLSKNERMAIRVCAVSLHEGIKGQIESSEKFYEDVKNTLLGRSNPNSKKRNLSKNSKKKL